VQNLITLNGTSNFVFLEKNLLALSTSGAGSRLVGGSGAGHILNYSADTIGGNVTTYSPTIVAIPVPLDYPAVSGTNGQFLYLAGSTPTGAPSLTYGGTTLVNVTANLIPTATLTYSLGSTTQRWKDAFIGPASLDIDGVKISAIQVGATTSQLTFGSSLLPSETLTYSLGLPPPGRLAIM
jgi:hypothetical protein